MSFMCCSIFENITKAKIYVKLRIKINGVQICKFKSALNIEKRKHIYFQFIFFYLHLRLILIYWILIKTLVFIHSLKYNKLKEK